MFAHWCDLELTIQAGFSLISQTLSLLSISQPRSPIIFRLEITYAYFTIVLTRAIQKLSEFGYCFISTFAILKNASSTTSYSVDLFRMVWASQKI